MALSPEGTEPDMNVVYKALLVQVHAQAQVSRFHMYLGAAAHRLSIVVIALSPKGTEPDIDVLYNPLSVPATDTSQQVPFTCRLGSSQPLHRGHGAES